MCKVVYPSSALGVLGAIGHLIIISDGESSLFGLRNDGTLDYEDGCPICHGSLKPDSEIDVTAFGKIMSGFSGFRCTICGQGWIEKRLVHYKNLSPFPRPHRDKLIPSTRATAIANGIITPEGHPGCVPNYSCKECGELTNSKDLLCFWCYGELNGEAEIVS